MATQQEAKGLPVPASVDDRLRRGRKVMLRDAAKRRLCLRFERGDTYWYLTDKGLLSFQPTVTAATGGGKPPHRIRNKINMIRPIVEAKVSQATQRIPSYDITPSTNDPQAEGAARLAEAVALYGYDKWRLREASIKAVKLAVTAEAGFAMPYFDPNVGPYRQVGDTWVGEGEIKVLILSANEVYWEPGVDFVDSSWYAIERAMPLDEVKRIPGYIGGDLAPDATTSDVPADRRDRGNQVMVTEYLERPSARFPQGRRMHMAAGRVICDYRLLDPTAPGPWESYPLFDADGGVIDEPVLHRLTYTHAPEDDRDLGLVWQLIDPQRTIQDCWNKLLEWKNRTLNPQMKAPVGSLVSAPNDVPGDVRYYRPVGGQVPEWEQPPAVPQALFQMLEQMKADMRLIAQDADVIDATDSAAKTLQAVIEQSQNRWQTFLGDLAEWHSRLMRHCLLLVARHYTEPRLLEIRGRFGPYTIRDFTGAQLMGQVSVTVLPGSLQARTRQQIVTEIMGYADRGWISPQVAMAAIQAGNAEKLIEGYELDVARANRIIQKITDGSVMSMGQWMVPDPVTGQPIEQPVFMPTPQDNLDVWKSVFSDWMKTEAYEQLPAPSQEAANLIYQGVIMRQQAQAQQAAVQQQAQAQALGMSNAALPARTPPAPDQRAITGQ